MQTGSISIVFFLGLLAPFACAAAQSNSAPLPALSPAQIIEKASPAVAMVLTTPSATSSTVSVGVALAVYKDGDLLTAYHLLRNAYAVQVRFASGETFDRVQLLSFDERRDVAAIRISSSALPDLTIANAAEASAGETVLSIFHSPAMPWATSTGVLSTYRLANEIPGAGSGFRVLQFTAPASPGVRGGILFDGQGRALGLITGSLDGGQALNFAVPIEGVLGLVDNAPIKTYASGSQLLPPVPGAMATPTVLTSTPQIAVAQLPSAQIPVVQPLAASVVSLTAQTQVPVANAEKQDVSASKDREYILRHFHTLYVDCKGTTYFGASQMKAALARNKDFAALDIRIVDDPKVADAVLVVSYTFAWDYPFELTHPNSSLVLLAGKGYGPFSGPVGAASVASQFVKLATPFRITIPKP